MVTYPRTFAYTVGLVADVLRGAAGHMLLGDRPSLRVAAGFQDDGDIALLGTLRESGLDTGA
ncbi:MAG: hypothetical protein HYX32_03595 [Actinobacteria bacterium]|nr:hypothetical protein [Actinomycetota bacterium]